MSRVGQVVAFTRTTLDGARISLVKVDLGADDPVTAEHYADAGDDSQPLVGDSAALAELVGYGEELVVGYIDPKTAAAAGPGERRLYSRSEPGLVAAEIWLKSDGSIAMTNESGGSIAMDADGTVTINGVVFDVDGNIKAKGEVTAKAAVPATSVGLSTHVHVAPGGATNAPTPGT